MTLAEPRHRFDPSAADSTIRGIAFDFSGTPTFTNLQIIYNDITNNLGPGIKIPSNVDLGNAVINNNNITGNVNFGIQNLSTAGVDAENNWWGNASGPSGEGPGTGDAVSIDVDYTPWLDASGGDSINTSTFTLVAGWNLISLPLIQTDPDIETVLAGAGVTVNKVSYFTGGPAGSWLSWFPSAPGNLDDMDDGKGYWIDVSAGGSLTAIGAELALPGQAPPTYDLVVGWNLIGFTSTTVKTVDVYLGSVLATVEAMYEYDAATGLYTAVLAGNSLASGEGYWLAVNAAGTIYP